MIIMIVAIKMILNLLPCFVLFEIPIFSFTIVLVSIKNWKPFLFPISKIAIFSLQRHRRTAWRIGSIPPTHTHKHTFLFFLLLDFLSFFSFWMAGGGGGGGVRFGRRPRQPNFRSVVQLWRGDDEARAFETADAAADAVAAAAAGAFNERGSEFSDYRRLVFSNGSLHRVEDHLRPAVPCWCLLLFIIFFLVSPLIMSARALDMVVVDCSFDRERFSVSDRALFLANFDAFSWALIENYFANENHLWY